MRARLHGDTPRMPIFDPALTFQLLESPSGADGQRTAVRSLTIVSGESA
jgi:hypothetical protein